MTKSRKIILVVCMGLLGLIILFARFMHSREIAKYEERGITAQAVIDDKESETKQFTRSTTETTNMLWVYVFIGKDSVRDLLTEYIDNDMYKSYKKGDKVDVIYLPEDYSRSVSFGPQLEGKTMLKSAMLATKARLPWYYLYAGICFVLGFLPFILKRKKV
jgi:hypothetical protein